MEPKEVFYFGCKDVPGHYWFPHNPRGKTVYEQVVKYIDGTFIPVGAKECEPVVNKIGNMIIISWVDNSVDKRPGSNSNLVGFNCDSAEQIMEAAPRLFPWVINRQSKPLILQP